MFIVPIAPIMPVSSVTPNQGVSPVSSIANGARNNGIFGTNEIQNSGFADVLSNAVASVNQADAKNKDNASLIAMGEADDLHTLQIETQKAALALDTVISFRNKVLDAYNEVMRINL